MDMIQQVIVINTKEDLELKLKNLQLSLKSVWKNYTFLNKRNYYRLVLFDNGNYGLFTQSQLPIVEYCQSIESIENSTNWADYKPYADMLYPTMRENGVASGTKECSEWTSIKKSRFRETEAWKNFKETFIYWNSNRNDCVICEDCKREIHKNFIEVHHIFPKEYDSLERKKFMLLCPDCHAIRTAKGE